MCRLNRLRDAAVPADRCCRPCVARGVEGSRGTVIGVPCAREWREKEEGLAEGWKVGKERWMPREPAIRRGVGEVVGESGVGVDPTGVRSASIDGTAPDTFRQKVSTGGSTAGGSGEVGFAKELRLADRVALRLLARVSLRWATTGSAGDVEGETRESTERDESPRAPRRGVRPKKLAKRKCRGSPATDATSDQDCELLPSLILREGWSSAGRAAKYEWCREGDGGLSGCCPRPP